MKETWQRLITWMRGSQHAEKVAVRVGAIDIVRAIATPIEFEQIVGAASDRRYVVETAAAVLGISEREILSRLSAASGCAAIEALNPFDMGTLPRGMTVQVLRELGATVTGNNGLIDVIACVDPVIIGALEAALPSAHIAVAPWSVIARHLDEGEAALAARRAGEAREHLARVRRVSETVMGLIIQAADDHDAKGVVLYLRDGAPRYGVQLPDGREASGELHPWLTAPLEEILTRGAFAAALPSGEVREVSSSYDSARQIGTLQWHRTLSETSPAKMEPAKPDAAPLPVEPSPLHAPVRRAERLATVFVIDDNPTFARVLEQFLERLNVESRLFRSAEEAWATLEDGAELDLIVCDVHMPGMGGREFVRRLRERLAAGDIPVVMLTSDDSLETEIELLGVGADIFFSKSEDPRRLAAYIERLIKGRQERRAA